MPPTALLHLSPEPDLSAAALAGDREAWQALVTRHGHRVVVALVARGVPVDRARDLAQDAWLRLMQQQRAGKLDHLTLPGLAIVQANFLARTQARRDATLRAALSALGPDGGGAGPPAADACLVDRERLGRVEAAFAACPANARRVFALVYDHPDWSYAEVAGRAGLSVQRVKQIVCEVRARLRAALDRDPSADDNTDGDTDRAGKADERRAREAKGGAG
jgi:RNA polymerase sigma-70 factor (ECF subfamily)